MSASQGMIEEKHRRALAMGEYLKQLPDFEEDPLLQELDRQTTLYRIALHNVIGDRWKNGKTRQ